MPSVPTTGSSNISVLDSKIIADLCAGKFYIDVTPSVYIASGKDNVLGANVQITSPSGVVIKPYGSNYEIGPPLSMGMDAVVQYNVPTQAGNFIYGKYTVDVELFDADGTSWVVTKTVEICEPDKKNKQRNYGSLSAVMNGVCKNGKLYIIVDGVPNYKGKSVSSRVQEFTLLYPTVSEVDPLVTTNNQFSVVLYEGEYKLTGEICATYSFGDNVYVNVKYKVKKSKTIRCLIDLCCVFTQLKALHNKLQSDCTQAEKEETQSIIFDTIRLVHMIEISASCDNEDVSEYITDLEALLGCSCTCNCAEGTPVINQSPTTDIIVQGCNVTEETVGLTRTYTIDNYVYKVTNNDNGGILVVGEATLNDCIQTQQITFNATNAYISVKAHASASNAEADAWAAIINKALRDINPTCLGYTTPQWNLLTYAEKFNAVFTRMCNCCGCSAEISDVEANQSGSSVILTWTNNAGVFLVNVYVDGILVGTVLSDLETFTIPDATGGAEKTYKLVPVCSNGEFGEPVEDVFYFTACPDVPPASLGTSLYEVACPFDLETALGLVAGEYEIHNMNNTLPSSLVGDPTAVNDGEYYVFKRVATGLGYCYSLGVKVTVLCVEEESCSAPQNLTNWLRLEGFVTTQYFRFDGAAYPPPANSYTAKRRLASDPDTPGSYTTLTAPSWNISAGKWEFYDAISGSEYNKLYVYRVESNCGGSPATTPYVDLNYVIFKCGFAITPTPDSDSIAYSIATGSTGEIDKIEVSIYDGATLVHTDTFLPAFSDPLVGTFNYLEPGTIYTIKVKSYIGAYYRACEETNSTTDGEEGGASGMAVILSNDLVSHCANAPTTVYTVDALVEPSPTYTLYFDAGLTVPVTGYTYVSGYPAGAIYNLNSGSGIVGAVTGDSCGS